jgi:hypothetical protein
MPNIKGSAMAGVMAIAKKQGDEFYRKWLAQLSEEERQAFHRLLPVKWYPITLNENNGVSVLAKMLFPNDPKAFRKIGALQVRESVNTIYKIFMNLPSVDFLISRAVQVWRTFHDTGEFKMEKVNAHESVITIAQYPQMPAYLRQIIWGGIEGLGELSGKTMQIALDESNPACWKWIVRH